MEQRLDQGRIGPPHAVAVDVADGLTPPWVEGVLIIDRVQQLEAAGAVEPLAKRAAVVIGIPVADEDERRAGQPATFQDLLGVVLGLDAGDGQIVSFRSRGLAR